MKSSKKFVNIKVNLKELFKYFLIFTKPLNKLRPKEIELLTEILYKNEIEKPNFKRDEDRWNKVFDYDSKVIYKDNLNIQDYTLQNLLSSLRKKGVIKNNQVQNYYIPNLDNNVKNFTLIFNFSLDG